MLWLPPQIAVEHCHKVLPAKSTSIGIVPVVRLAFHVAPISTPLSVSSADTAPPMSGLVPST